MIGPLPPPSPAGREPVGGGGSWWEFKVKEFELLSFMKVSPREKVTTPPVGVRGATPSLLGKSDVDNIGVCVRAGGEAASRTKGDSLLTCACIVRKTENKTDMAKTTLFIYRLGFQRGKDR